jgi:two-component system, cell cycle sensor histidine kinase and response regulator CckA
MSDASFVFEDARWPVIVLDSEGIIRLVNQAAEMAFGLIIEGKTNLNDSIWLADNPKKLAQLLQELSDSPQHLVRVKLRLKDASPGWFDCLVFPLLRDGRKCSVLQFLPAAKTAGAQAEPTSANADTANSPVASTSDAAANQKQKLDCALQLIRTVVLDFNNALTSILGHTSLLLGKIDASHPWHNSLSQVEKSAEKAAEIANDLASFSRQDRDVRTLDPGNLNDLLRRTIEVFQTPAFPAIRWNLQLESRLYAVNFDEAKMQQAFMKVLDNSLQAIPGEGEIKLTTRNLDVAEQRSEGQVSLAPGYYVSVEFADNGCGIAPDLLPRIFEPFFTTKPNHRGLGLAWVYGIVTNHGGTVAVSSQLGSGTSVHVYLPATPRIVKDKAFDADELTGGETILIVDDEDLLLTMGHVVLSSFGYNVLTANSGERAIDIVAQQAGAVDLVITDMVMPTMSGRELMDHLRSLAPQVKIICSSGYVRPSNHDELEIYLQKPFTSQELLRKVKQALA